jgi:4-aminobutyrate aminotransferase-like enzyme/Ser/Thr protein kinase RdoA (MazF antagonist)
VHKISQTAEDRGRLACQTAVLDRLATADTGFAFPTLVPDRDGQVVVPVGGPDGAIYLTRLLRFVPGIPLAEVRHHTPALLEEVGRLTGSVARALDGFTHPGAHHDLRWDLRVGRQVVDQCSPAIARSEQRARIQRLMTMFDRYAVPRLAELPMGVIHNDANDFNVLVSPADPADQLCARHITGLVDFGDLVHSYKVGELAIAAAYAMLRKRDPLAAAAAVVGGHHRRHVLTEPEVTALFPLICLRLCTSAVLSAHQRAQEPGNAYLSVSEADVWALLAALETIDPRHAECRLREACGWPASAAGHLVTEWLAAHAASIGPVLAIDPRTAPRVTLDLSVGSTEWSDLDGRHDTAAWTAAIVARMRAAGARLAIGRYDEARRWYTAPQYRVTTDEGDEWRTVHLGVDLFVEAGTDVLAPLDGTVESVRDNAGPLDYGPTVILRHAAAPGARPWYTLYGHLGRSALTLRPGQVIARGDRIGNVGGVDENGGWPPHLHLQLIVDLLGYVGDFPGVARSSERAMWLSLSPDPNLLLQLAEGCRAAERPAGDVRRARQERIGPSLSIAYREPLTIVRGSMQYLYDETGRAYLDGVNNVAHVGHCHPRVVAALRDQAAVLNTNTRYLHPALTRYAERLVRHLPSPLRVCYFVCSGSEANELALRLARAHTGRRDVIVVDHAYHGNTTTLVELSPYKFDGPGGAGAPAHVHKVIMPDPYRGPYPGYSTAAGARYSALVGETVAALAASGRPAGTFIAEAISSGGGQVEPPAGYLSEAYRHVRAAGGLCIADEVQIGFGRMGSHFWGFETQDVVPDIVTMGKPIGNGHPLGAVVTTPEIAASFANGMEYFNTFGGNAVSCAVGLAVLDVIEEEGLQESARTVGDRLIQGLRGLGERHALIGDVRGRGLFLGVELVLDRVTRASAPRHATYVVERMKDRGILLSTEGPLHTVIKMKPPLAFGAADADCVLTQLDDVLGELA